ncbi:MAG: hypothetical protein L7S63_07750 [Flavobacteriales bacterium]|nr:hypothetical protein [Flavobacteriales bacterium]
MAIDVRHDRGNLLVHGGEMLTLLALRALDGRHLVLDTAKGLEPVLMFFWAGWLRATMETGAMSIATVRRVTALAAALIS